ncbi:MAG TPA: beta-ketoacyl-[acyl-carrier-protein] synthase family protein [Psychromonas hadalis]|nr:beta-ketoacyl-[acyl-carrier-protein] synthase family protein [Psychromonas hadalis]
MSVKHHNRQNFPLYIHASAMNCALGESEQQQIDALNAGVSDAMVLESTWLNDGKSTVVGKVISDLPLIDSDKMPHKNTRNNRIALSALLPIEEEIQAAIKSYGSDRIAVVVGTSTSGIEDGEIALGTENKTGTLPDGYHYHQQEVANLGDFVAQYFSISGPVYTISTACSSSARVFISAKRLLKSGMVDAVLVGGADSLCKLTLNGFHGLEALSTGHCLPFSENRKGINIGEGAAFMLLSNKPNQTGIALLGAGDSSDAHHISAPHPEGKGAMEAMQKALDEAVLNTDQIGYINAHGTATKLNDAMESKAIYALFSDKVAVSSTKPLTGHTLGAAGIIEAMIAYLVLKNDLDIPLQINDGCVDPEFAEIQLVKNKMKLQKKAIMSNSFAFGGNNMSLILGVADE